MAERRGLALTALALGVLGLFTAGGLLIGSLVGLALAATCLLRDRPRTGRDVAWAALAANIAALLTILPLSGAVLSDPLLPGYLRTEEMPEPAQPQAAFVDLPPAPPPPPPPPLPGLSAENAPIRIGGAIREPRKTRHVNPAYPEIARQARVQGTVILECTISPKGQVLETKVLRGIPLLTEAAVEAVRQWEYTPTLLDGRAVPVIMTVTVKFKLG